MYTVHIHYLFKWPVFYRPLCRSFMPQHGQQFVFILRIRTLDHWSDLELLIWSCKRLFFLLSDDLNNSYESLFKLTVKLVPGFSRRQGSLGLQNFANCSHSVTSASLNLPLTAAGHSYPWRYSSVPLESQHIRSSSAALWTLCPRTLQLIFLSLVQPYSVERTRCTAA